ncbi:hypothetical protein lerEdw1_006341 [Lerista edwardsae]|nr:hypothetical protein lerEdw1_006341 [Lerista edwardsae]
MAGPAGGEPCALLLGCSEVPASVTESFILTGYRRPGYSLAQCLRSAFRPTNETGNFWTHFLALFVFAFHFLQPFWAQGPPRARSLAHLLSSLSLPAREVCFYVDHGTISAYTVGAALAYHHYIRPQGAPAPANRSAASPWPAGEGAAGLPGTEGQAGPWLEALYVPAACLAALLCTWACCSSRRQWPQHRYLVRTLVFLLPFLVVSTPVFLKLWRAGAGPGTGRYFLRHCLWLLASGVLNVSKVPERLSPGRFDVWGHSHQWLHCCTAMSILDELHMLWAEVRELAAGLPPLRRAPTFLSTFGVMLLLLTLLAGIVGWFGASAYRASQLQGKPRGKGD